MFSCIFLSLCQNRGRNPLLPVEHKQWVCNTRKLRSDLLTTTSATTAGKMDLLGTSEMQGNVTSAQLQGVTSGN